MNWKDRTAQHNLSIIIYIISIALAAALIITGLVGAIWGAVEMFRHVTTWVL